MDRAETLRCWNYHLISISVHLTRAFFLASVPTLTLPRRGASQQREQYVYTCFIEESAVALAVHSR